MTLLEKNKEKHISKSIIILYFSSSSSPLSNSSFFSTDWSPRIPFPLPMTLSRGTLQSSLVQPQTLEMKQDLKRVSRKRRRWSLSLSWSSLLILKTWRCESATWTRRAASTSSSFKTTVGSKGQQHIVNNQPLGFSADVLMYDLTFAIN